MSTEIYVYIIELAPEIDQEIRINYMLPPTARKMLFENEMKGEDEEHCRIK